MEAGRLCTVHLSSRSVKAGQSWQNDTGWSILDDLPVVYHHNTVRGMKEVHVMGHEQTRLAAKKLKDTLIKDMVRHLCVHGR